MEDSFGCKQKKYQVDNGNVFFLVHKLCFYYLVSFPGQAALSKRLYMKSEMLQSLSFTAFENLQNIASEEGEICYNCNTDDKCK